MRGTMGTLIIFLVCLVVVVLYLFLGKGQINLAAVSLEGQIEEQDVQFNKIRQIRGEIPILKASLPLWREQLEIFNTAIPLKVDDHIFFGSLVEQLDQHPGVRLLSLNSVFGGPWLGRVDEDVEEKLREYKIDVESAKSIRVSFFTLELLGEFDEVLTVIENLKMYRRLFTIDMIAGPAGRGSGTVISNNQPEITPIQVTGRLYFNLPEPKVDVNELTRMFLEVFAGMLQNDMVSAGQEAAKGPGASSQPKPDGSSAMEHPETTDESLDENPDGAEKDNQDSQAQDAESGDIALAGIGDGSEDGVMEDRLL